MADRVFKTDHKSFWGLFCHLQIYAGTPRSVLNSLSVHLCVCPFITLFWLSSAAGDIYHGLMSHCYLKSVKGTKNELYKYYVCK